jgi:hypothetical protein
VREIKGLGVGVRDLERIEGWRVRWLRGPFGR